MKRSISILLGFVLLLCSTAFAENAVIACVGDSITYGVIPNTAGKQTEGNYPAVLATLLGEKYDVENFGKPGSSLTEKGVCYRNRDGYQLSLDAAADMYIIMLGTNDANKKNEWDAVLYESDLNDMVDAYRAASPDAVIFLMAPPAVFPDEVTGETTMDEERLRGEIRDIVAGVASGKQTGYIDLFAATEAHPEWFGGDGIHPVDEGYDALAHIVYEAVQEEAEGLVK